MIKAEHLTKNYRSKAAVHDLSFTVEPGRVTGFLGPNGAGKSTTMRLMLGLDLGKGTTTFDGQTLREYVRPAEMVGILLEAKAFHPTRTARNHLRVLAAASGVKDRRVDEALELVGLQTVADNKPGKFSLGMSQRLGIAAAILSEPRYLLLDEPANGLDPEGIVWLRHFIKAYADNGNGVLVSSHLLSEMAQMADDVIVIGHGRLIANTSMEDMIARSGHSAIFVRTTDAANGKLEDELRRRQVPFESAGTGLKVHAPSTDVVGKLAFKHGIPILELTAEEASLEEAFLALTENSVEYEAHDIPGEAKK